MLRHALRRLLWTLPTLVGVSLLTFFVLSFVPDPTDDPLLASSLSSAELARLRRERFLDLPRFINLEPRDVRLRALAAAQAIAAGGDGAAAAADELRRLGGAALPHILPLDALAPEPRTRVALALAPVAARMGLPRADEAADPAHAVAFWTRFWDDRGIEFRSASVRSAVRRLVRYGSASRASELLELDTFALQPVIAALQPPRDAAALEQARALVDVAAHITEIDDRIAPGEDLAEARACVTRWKSFWNVYRSDFEVFSGPARLAATVLETRYGKWALGAVTHRLGIAATGEPVLDELARRAPVTLTLVFGAIALAYAVAVPLGALSAASRGRRSDSAVAAAVLTLAVLPTAVVAVAAALLSGGAQSLLLPTCLIALSLIAAPTRQQRAALVAVLTQDFIRAARARGAGTARAIAVHGLRNAVLPVVTLAVLEPPMALGGAFVVERVFELHGLGELTLLAVQARDVSWLMAISIGAAGIAALGVIATDLAYVLVDPRLGPAVLSRRGGA
ncbi:ABC transporter permease subunit [Sorangium sp. So ce1078]|uniref:ABC transporter permease n=1 Tax=Sorangium sp. So ce1078 TaxID=3133329 RepID=UPI003F630D2F